MMINHDLLQGTPEWCQFRLDHDGASEAAAMLGLSKTVKRSELLRMKKTGIAREFCDWVQKNILDYGHEVEAMARPYAEEIIGDQLYPVTCSNGRLSASCDGLDLDDTIGFEHKQWEKELAASVASGVVPLEHMPQCQQVMLVTGAKKVMFMVSNGTRENMVYCWVDADPDWFDRIRAGWKQFHIDLENYVPEEVDVVVTATPTRDLPALSIRVDGSISLVSNLDKFGALLSAFIAGINQKPEDDQGFADAENAIKVLQKAQDALEAAEASSLAQTSSIDEMRRTVKLHADTARTTRLMLEKMVKVRKEQIRTHIVMEGKNLIADHIVGLENRIHPIRLPAVSADFAGVIKGKKTIESLRDARDTELANAKIRANYFADKISANLETMRELASDYKYLFVDTSAIIMKDNSDLILLINARIAEHKLAEEKRFEAERERIREQERIKAEAAVKAEQERILAERAAKLIEDERKARIEEDQRYEAERKARAIEDNARYELVRQQRAAMEKELEVIRAAEAAKREDLLKEQEVLAASKRAEIESYDEPVIVTDKAPEPIQADFARAFHAIPDGTGKKINLARINEELDGLVASSDFLVRKGFKFEQVKSSKMFQESDLPAIFGAIEEHARLLRIAAMAAYSKAA